MPTHEKMSVWDGERSIAGGSAYDDRATTDSQCHDCIAHSSRRTASFNRERSAPSIGAVLLDFGGKSGAIKPPGIDRMRSTDFFRQLETAVVEVARDDGSKAESLATVDGAQTHAAKSSDNQRLLAALVPAGSLDRAGNGHARRFEQLKRARLIRRCLFKHGREAGLEAARQGAN